MLLPCPLETTCASASIAPTLGPQKGGFSGASGPRGPRSTILLTTNQARRLDTSQPQALDPSHLFAQRADLPLEHRLGLAARLLTPRDVVPVSCWRRPAGSWKGRDR